MDDKQRMQQVEAELRRLAVFEDKLRHLVQVLATLTEVVSRCTNTLKHG